MHPRSPEFYTGPFYLPLLNRGSGFELSVLFELFCSFYSVIFCCILGVSVVLFALCPRGVWPGQNKTTSIINWRGVGSYSPPPPLTQLLHHLGNSSHQSSTFHTGKCAPTVGGFKLSCRSLFIPNNILFRRLLFKLHF